MKPIKDNRSFFKFFILNTITFGIYQIFYFHSLIKDVNRICSDDDRESPGVFAFYFFSILTFGLYAIFYWYRVADMLKRASDRKRVPTDISGGFVAVCFILNYFSFSIGSLVGIYKVISATNDLAEDYNRKLK